MKIKIKGNDDFFDKRKIKITTNKNGNPEVEVTPNKKKTNFFDDDRMGLEMLYNRKKIEEGHTKINGWVLSAQDGFGTYCSHNGTDFEIALFRDTGEWGLIELDGETVMSYVPKVMITEIIKFLLDHKGIPKEEEVREEILRLSKIYREG
jgi:hypothetical protein